MAERTGERAANLRGNAQRAAILFGDIDDLDLMPACDPHQIFARAIGRDLLGHNFGQFDHEILGQKLAIIFRQIGHLVEIAHTPVIDPLPKLVCPHLGLFFGRASSDQRLAHRLAGHADKVLGPFRRFARNG